MALVGLSGLDDGAASLAAAARRAAALRLPRTDRQGTRRRHRRHPEPASPRGRRVLRKLTVSTCSSKSRSPTHSKPGRNCARSRRATASTCSSGTTVGTTTSSKRLPLRSRNDIGRLVATNAMVTMRKPDSYYEPEWRRSAGAGPLLVNLVHEVDLQRAVCGDIDRVQAASAKVGRELRFRRHGGRAAPLPQRRTRHHPDHRIDAVAVELGGIGQRGHGIPQRGPRPCSVRRHRGISRLSEHDDLDVSTRRWRTRLEHAAPRDAHRRRAERSVRRPDRSFRTCHPRVGDPARFRGRRTPQPCCCRPRSSRPRAPARSSTSTNSSTALACG